MTASYRMVSNFFARQLFSCTAAVFIISSSSDRNRVAASTVARRVQPDSKDPFEGYQFNSLNKLGKCEAACETQQTTGAVFTVIPPEHDVAAAVVEGDERQRRWSDVVATTQQTIVGIPKNQWPSLPGASKSKQCRGSNGVPKAHKRSRKAVETATQVGSDAAATKEKPGDAMEMADLEKVTKKVSKSPPESCAVGVGGSLNSGQTMRCDSGSSTGIRTRTNKFDFGTAKKLEPLPMPTGLTMKLCVPQPGGEGDVGGLLAPPLLSNSSVHSSKRTSLLGPPPTPTLPLPPPKSEIEVEQVHILPDPGHDEQQKRTQIVEHDMPVASRPSKDAVQKLFLLDPSWRNLLPHGKNFLVGMDVVICNKASSRFGWIGQIVNISPAPLSWDSPAMLRPVPQTSPNDIAGVMFPVDGKRAAQMEYTLVQFLRPVTDHVEMLDLTPEDILPGPPPVIPAGREGTFSFLLFSSVPKFSY